MLDTAASSVSAGYGHTCAVTTAGGVRCWGNNTSGEVGDGTTTDRASPSADLLTSAQAVSLGYAHTCALTTAGGVRCWGDNSHGQLGDGTTTSRSTPPTSDVLTGVTSIATGDYHTCAVTSAGGLRCWGYNSSGQLGNGGTNQLTTPPTSDILAGVRSVVAGSAHTCALMTSGGVRCWGNNQYYQLYTSESTLPVYTPPSTDSLTGISALFSSYNDVCAIDSAYQLECWGKSFYQASNLFPVDAVAVSASHVCVSSSSAYCWGQNSWGQLGDGTTTNRSSPTRVQNIYPQAIAAGALHSCAIEPDGSVACWGYNIDGELGNGTMVATLAPTAVNGLATACN